MSKILLVGNDSRLLVTRAAVLAQTKASIACCNASEAAQALEGESFDLVVLCHSLTGKQADGIVEMVHQKLPGAKILMITSVSSQDQPSKGVVFDGVISADPAGLVSRASALLLQKSIRPI